MPHRIILAIIIALAAAVPCSANTRLRPVKTTDYTFAVWSDLHIQVELVEVYEDPVLRCSGVLEFIAAHEPKPTFLLLTGDQATGTWKDESYLPWESDYGVVHEPQINIAGSYFLLQEWADTSGIPIIPVAGNHESTYYIDESYTGPPEGTDWDPYETARKYWRKYWPSWRSGNKEFYATTYNSVRVLAMSNNVDTLQAEEGAPAYWSCNPPASDALGAANPDYSGFVTPGSRQWTWAVDQITNSTEIWTIPAFHRAVYGLCALPLRPNIYQARHGIVKDMTDAGARLFFHGDIHQGSVVGPVNSNVLDQNGAYFVTLHRNFAIRPINETLVPAGSILYPDEDMYGETQTGAHFAICHVYGKRIHLKIYHVADCDDPLPELVFDMGVRQ